MQKKKAKSIWFSTARIPETISPRVRIGNVCNEVEVGAMSFPTLTIRFDKMMVSRAPHTLAGSCDAFLSPNPFNELSLQCLVVPLPLDMPSAQSLLYYSYRCRPKLNNTAVNSIRSFTRSLSHLLGHSPRSLHSQV